MIVKALTFTTTRSTIVTLFPQDVVDSLRVHTLEPTIKQATFGQSHVPMATYTNIVNDQVDHVVACHVGSAAIFLVEMLPQEHVLECLV